MATTLQPNLPVFDSKSKPPPLFNGTPRLYISLTCPYAQRVWIARNYKGLDSIELMPINLADKPSWYAEKVYPAGKVPSLEHNGKVMGESLDLLEYLEKNFDGPPMMPMGLAKQNAVSKLLKYTDTFTKAGFTALRTAMPVEANLDEVGSAFDHLEDALNKYADEGPYLVGQLSVADFAYIPFVERFQLIFSQWLNYDVTEGRVKLIEWIEAMNQEECYTKTKSDPNVLLGHYKRLLGKL